MRRDKAIPLVVGVSGHLALRRQDLPALKEAVRSCLESLRQEYPHTPLVLLDSLARGADLLCAETAEELGVPLMAALPLEAGDYERDFDSETLPRFRAQLARADRVFVTPASESPPPEPDRDFFYRQAGIYVAGHCHVLLALWDGGAPAPGGCGTAEAVDFALREEWACSAPAHGGRIVIHLHAPRSQEDPTPPGTLRRLGDGEMSRLILARTEEYNRLAASLPPPTKRLLPEDADADGVLRDVERRYQAADRLSLTYAEQYRRVLAALAGLGTAITLAFLLYDEAELHALILLCGAALLAAWLCRRFAQRSECHRRFIEYRMLAEALRVQGFLRYAGSPTEIVSLLSWCQQEDAAWIAAALETMCPGPAPGPARDIRRCWIEAQRNYHQQAAKKSDRKLSASDRVVRLAFIGSVALYLAALIFELCFGGLLPLGGLSAGTTALFRAGLKIALGTLSAATLFISGYYGHLSLDQVSEDHRKMGRFYALVSGLLERQGQTEALLRAVAREELSENLRWCAYQRDNAPSLEL